MRACAGYACIDIQIILSSKFSMSKTYAYEYDDI